MMANLVLLCLLSCVSGWIVKLPPSMSGMESYNAEVDKEMPISTLNYAIIEHVQDMLGEISKNLESHGTLGKMGKDARVYCFGDVLETYKDCRERCQSFNSTYQIIICTTQDFISYLTSCATGTMVCYGPDINECLDDNGGCAQTCENTAESFSCSCDTGYLLGDDGKSCTEINECLMDNGGCAETCENTVGSFRCSCDTGYLLGDDGKSCTDINECLDNNGVCAQTCRNTDGSFICSCDSGNLDEDGKSCTGSICMFPFIYKGISYSACTTVDSGNEEKTWCSTETDEFNNYIDNASKWKYCGGCGEYTMYTTSNGILKHPLSGTYDRNLDCRWIINAAEPIEITFLWIDIEEDFDFLYVMNGPSLDSPLLGNFSGNSNPNPVQTTQNSAILLFTSDNSQQQLGFELSWEPIQ